MSFQSIVSPVLISRVGELELLVRLLTEVQAGRGNVVLLAGEAGIGKSRLVAEVSSRAVAANLRVLEGRCFEPDFRLPYAPILDLVRNQITADRDQFPGDLAPELLTLLPELQAHRPDLSLAPVLEPEQEKRRLWQALLRLITRLGMPPAQAQAGPLLLVFEDLHWSDDTSLEFLLYLARRITAQPILLLLTYRNDESNFALAHFLAELDRERLATELTLHPLTRAEVEAQVQAIFGMEQPVRAEFLDALYGLTEGNPFSVEEVLKALVAGGEIFYAEGRWDRKPFEELHIPRSVQDAVQRRTLLLSPDARHVLTIAAVAGRRFDFALLQEVTTMNETALFQVIKELITAQLVVEETAEQFAFRHALTREAVYTTLLLRERKKHHRMIAEVIERLYAESIEAYLSDLAYHFGEAGVWHKALEYSQRAGEKARGMYAPREASIHFTRALEAARHLSHSPATPHLLHARARALSILGEFERAKTDYEAVLQLARTRGDRQGEWQAQLDLGFLWASRDYAKSGEYFQRALALARALGDPATLGHTLNRVGNWYTNVERLHEALPQHREALDIFQELQDRPGMAETYDLLGLTCILSGDWKQGAANYEHAIALFRELDDRHGLVSALATFAERGIMYFDGPFPSHSLSKSELMAEAEEALRLAREIGWRSGEAYALCILSSLCATFGEIGRALEVGHSALEIAQEIGHQQWRTLALQALGGLYLGLFELDRAQQYLEQALRLARETQSLLFIRQSASWLAEAYILLGQSHDLDRAEEVLDSAAGPDRHWQTLGERLCGYAYVELALARGDAVQAWRLVNALQPEAEKLPQEGVTPGLWRLRGEALTLLNRLDEAETALHTALAALAKGGATLLEWQIRLALGHVYRLRRNREQAEAEFETARELVHETAARIPDAELQNNFRERALARIPTLPPSTALRAAKKEFGGLTAREREVAALIAQGKSNAEVAKSLIVGERTVEGHVSSILSKLGFASRTQIAAWAVEKGLQK